MDLHIAPGVTARQVAEAHLLDVKLQDHFLCKAITYWLDEDKGCVFCLIEAPDKESVRQMHEKAHGLIPNEIIPVDSDVVKAFLGRIKDPDDAIRHPETNLKVFSDPAFRIILVTKTMDRRLLQHTFGAERAQELLLLYTTLLREQCRAFGGSEVYSLEDGFVIAFASKTHALECAQAIQNKLSNAATYLGLRIALHAGVPVDKDEAIFGAAIRFTKFMCNFGEPGQIIMSAVVRNLFKDNDWNLATRQNNTRWLTSAEENFMTALLNTLVTHWHDAEFELPDFCRMMSVSKSQLYRKCISITGMSPNILLREYRLLQSLEMLRTDKYNISQTTFDTGFSSPSYFTKCFQKRFGVPPLAYLKTSV